MPGTPLKSCRGEVWAREGPCATRECKKWRPPYASVPVQTVRFVTTEIEIREPFYGCPTLPEVQAFFLVVRKPLTHDAPASIQETSPSHLWSIAPAIGKEALYSTLKFQSAPIFKAACLPEEACVGWYALYTSIFGGAMRTNIVIDNSLMRQAMKATGLSTKKSVVEEGLRLLIKVKGQTGIRRLRGKVTWEGDLNVMREIRVKAAS